MKLVQKCSKTCPTIVRNMSKHVQHMMQYKTNMSAESLARLSTNPVLQFVLNGIVAFLVLRLSVSPYLRRSGDRQR